MRSAARAPTDLAVSLEGSRGPVGRRPCLPGWRPALLALLVGWLALTGRQPDRALTLLGIAVPLSAVGRLGSLDAVAHGTYEVPAWAASLWPASARVTAIAAWQPLVAVRPVQLEGRRLLVLPLGHDRRAGAPVCRTGRRHQPARDGSGARDAVRRGGTAVADARRGHRAPRREPRRGDDRPAGGLGNHRALVNDLDEQMVHAWQQHPLLLLFYDLDGFKAYDDVYGSRPAMRC